MNKVTIIVVANLSACLQLNLKHAMLIIIAWYWEYRGFVAGPDMTLNNNCY